MIEDKIIILFGILNASVLVVFAYALLKFKERIDVSIEVQELLTEVINDLNEIDEE